MMCWRILSQGARCSARQEEDLGRRRGAHGAPYRCRAPAGGTLRRADFRERDYTARRPDSHRERRASRSGRSHAILPLSQLSQGRGVIGTRQAAPFASRRTMGTEAGLLPWPTKNLPEVVGGQEQTLQALVREYLFVSLYKACAESLASENASRLAAMQRAEKNIDDLVGTLNQTFRRLRRLPLTRSCSRCWQGTNHWPNQRRTEVSNDSSNESP